MSKYRINVRFDTDDPKQAELTGNLLDIVTVIVNKFKDIIIRQQNLGGYDISLIFGTGTHIVKHKFH